MSLQSPFLLFLLQGLIIVVLQVRQNHPHGPVQFIDLQLPQRTRFLMRMQEVDQVDDLKHHLSDLEVIKYHIIFHHELEGPMMIIKDQIIRISFYLLLSAHIGWDLALNPSSVFYRDPVEPNEIGAGISLQLF